MYWLQISSLTLLIFFIIFTRVLIDFGVENSTWLLISTIFQAFIRFFISVFIIYMSLYFLRTIRNINNLLLNENKQQKIITLLIFYFMFASLNTQVILHQVLTTYRLVILNLKNDQDCQQWYTNGQAVFRIMSQVNQFIQSTFIPIFIVYLTTNMMGDSKQYEPEQHSQPFTTNFSQSMLDQE